MNIEHEFNRRLEFFRVEVESAMQFFYAYLTIHDVASEDTHVYEVLNDYAVFWMTNLGALQTSAFIVIGRIFDKTSDHNVHELIGFAMSNPSIFSKDALRERKANSSPGVKPWLNKYINEAYEPKASDFTRLRGYVSKYNKLYTRNYRDLRHKIFAHSEVSDREGQAKLFAKTNVRELERMLAFLASLHDALSQMLINGRKPILRPRRYSMKSIRRGERTGGRTQQIQERITHQTEAFLRTLKT
ncbi:hypothetical protein [Dyella sp. 20L07]|uniref:AbiU2 domain-containing protein n=1 Tax=Dyella sp. 20L07 TaxID=3384240 RepID=UPI003D2C13CA